MGKVLKHLKTVRTHRKYVRKACWKMGLFWQGLTHDLSKYSCVEMRIAKYYTGKGSPHEECRRQIGYSPSWIHHFHKNKHHYQYWLEDNENGQWYGIKIPFKYVVEQLADFIGAGKAYDKKNWTVKSPLIYWNKCCEGKRIMHKDSLYLIKKLLWNLDQSQDEKAFYAWFKQCKDHLKKCYEEGLEDY